MSWGRKQFSSDTWAGVVAGAQVVTIALTGVSAAGSVGTLAPQASAGVSGNAATSAVGTVAPKFTRALA